MYFDTQVDLSFDWTRVLLGMTWCDAMGVPLWVCRYASAAVRVLYYVALCCNACVAVHVLPCVCCRASAAARVLLCVCCCVRVVV